MSSNSIYYSLLSVPDSRFLDALVSSRSHFCPASHFSCLPCSVSGAERRRPVCREWKPRDSMWLCREAAPQGVGPVPGVADGLLPCPRGGGYRGGICGPWSTRGTGANVQPITGVNTSWDKSKLWSSTESGTYSNSSFLFGFHYQWFSLKVDSAQRKESGILFSSTRYALHARWFARDVSKHMHSNKVACHKTWDFL